MRSLRLALAAVAVVTALVAQTSTAAAQSLVGLPFEDVVRYLASQDPKLRVEAMRTLAQTGHPDAIGPIARNQERMASTKVLTRLLKTGSRWRRSSTFRIEWMTVE